MTLACSSGHHSPAPPNFSSVTIRLLDAQKGFTLIFRELETKMRPSRRFLVQCGLSLVAGSPQGSSGGQRESCLQISTAANVFCPCCAPTVTQRVPASDTREEKAPSQEPTGLGIEPRLPSTLEYFPPLSPLVRMNAQKEHCGVRFPYGMCHIQGTLRLIIPTCDNRAFTVFAGVN